MSFLIILDTHFTLPTKDLFYKLLPFWREKEQLYLHTWTYSKIFSLKHSVNTVIVLYEFT